jgi:hypothetical protein
MDMRSLVTVLILLLIVISFSTQVSGSDELKSDLIEAILSLDKPGLFDDYGELELVKTKIQAVLQGMESREVTSSTNAWVHIFLSITEDFEGMVNVTRSPAPSDHIQALETAERIDASIETLRGYDVVERNGIPLLAELALKRFYRLEGNFFEEAARNEAETRVRIDYERRSSIAYSRGGMPSEASRMDFEARRDEGIYTRDMEKASEYLTAAQRHLDNALHPSSQLFGAAFMEILKARDSFEHAQKIYEKHKDSELENVQGLGREIQEVYYSLMRKTLIVIAVYLIILSFIAVMLWWNFQRWSDELDDTRLGEELIG